MRMRGFTLIEVLVALAIVTVGMSAVLATLTSAADTTAYLREKSFADWVAMNRLAEVRLQMTPPPVGKSSGSAELAGRRWQWEQVVTKLDVPGASRVDVHVRAEDAASRDRGGWTSTVTAIVGTSLDPPRGVVPPWMELPGSRGRERGGEDRGPPDTPPPPDPEPEPQEDVPEEPQPREGAD